MAEEQTITCPKCASSDLKLCIPAELRRPVKGLDVGGDLVVTGDAEEEPDVEDAVLECQGCMGRWPVPKEYYPIQFE